MQKDCHVAEGGENNNNNNNNNRRRGHLFGATTACKTQLFLYRI